MRTPTVILSPYRGHVARNLAYLELCLEDSWRRGELPWAPHAFLPRFLNDSVPGERALALSIGQAIWPGAERFAAYVDLGLSEGMHGEEEEIFGQLGKLTERRMIFDRLELELFLAKWERALR